MCNGYDASGRVVGNPEAIITPLLRQRYALVAAYQVFLWGYCRANLVCCYRVGWVRQLTKSGDNKGTIRADMRYLVVSKDVRQHRLISSDYITTLRCHGRGRGLESRRPRHSIPRGFISLPASSLPRARYVPRLQEFLLQKHHRIALPSSLYVGLRLRLSRPVPRIASR